MFRKRLDVRRLVEEGISKAVESNQLTSEDAVLIRGSMWRPGVRRRMVDMIEDNAQSQGLIDEDGVIQAEDEGTYGSIWILLIQGFITFLPILLEFLKNR
jgi:hypothetical protein